MMTFWQYLCDNPATLIIMVVFGGVFGVFTSCFEGYNWKERLGHICVVILMWVFITYPAVSWMDYTDYKKHYVTCEKPVAKRAGYIFAENRCWKPVTSYVKVNETTKSKQELLNEQ
jgi:hypothetical protein